MFCISFSLDEAMEPGRLVGALNARLERDIRVTGCRPVEESFHARYSARAKRYLYLICNAREMEPVVAGRAAHFVPHIDEAGLDAVAQVFVGRHDFGAFCSKRARAGSVVRTVSEMSVSRRGDLVEFSITADGFLYNMARAMAGALLNAARGRLTRRDIAKRLSTGVRDNLIFTAPAEGLYLDRVFY
jgi:tRNA pseudouridine38-40 synthase